MVCCNCYWCCHKRRVCEWSNNMINGHRVILPVYIRFSAQEKNLLEMRNLSLSDTTRSLVLSLLSLPVCLSFVHEKRTTARANCVWSWFIPPTRSPSPPIAAIIATTINTNIWLFASNNYCTFLFCLHLAFFSVQPHVSLFVWGFFFSFKL